MILSEAADPIIESAGKPSCKSNSHDGNVRSEVDGGMHDNVSGDFLGLFYSPMPPSH